MRELAEAVLAQDSRLHLLLLVRPDAVGIVTDIVGGGAPYQIRPLSAKDALAAVSAPIAGTGRVFAEGAAEMLVADLRISPSVATGTGTHYTTADCIEPALLQVVCARLWRELPDDVNIITARDVRAFADVDTTLASHCGQIIAAVADEHDLSAKRLRSWMLSTFVTDQEARASEYEKRADVAGMPRAVVRALVDLHLLTVTLRDGERSYKLLADRLIEPLRRSAEERPLAAKPAEQLRAAERALTSGELDLAERYVNVALCACSQGELRLRAEGMSLRGNLAYECGDPKRAEEQYAEAASLFEAVRDTGAVASELAAVGQMMLAQERTAEAVQQLRAAVDREPNALVAQTQLALALWKLGEGRAAVAVLTAALGIDGGNVVALCARGEILADLGEARTAMLDLDRVTESADPAVHAARGLALAELGDQAAARQEIEDALTSSTTWNGPVLYYAARASSLMRDEVTARELAKRAVIATDPALSAPHRNRALQLAGRRTADQINTGRCLPLL
jgi:tetratricopeptide (TPR) repeat protein